MYFSGQKLEVTKQLGGILEDDLSWGSINWSGWCLGMFQCVLVKSKTQKKVSEQYVFEIDTLGAGNLKSIFPTVALKLEERLQ